MDVVLVTTNFFKVNIEAFADFLRNSNNSERGIVREECFAVFNRKDDVVVSVIDIVERMHVGHVASIYWETNGFPDPFLAVIAAAARKSLGVLYGEGLQVYTAWGLPARNWGCCKR